MVVGTIQQTADQLGLATGTQGELVGISGSGLGGSDLAGNAGALVEQVKHLGVQGIKPGPDSVQRQRRWRGLGHLSPEIEPARLSHCGGTRNRRQPRKKLARPQ